LVGFKGDECFSNLGSCGGWFWGIFKRALDLERGRRLDAGGLGARERCIYDYDASTFAENPKER
jgi:hypothetical protein